MGDGYVVAEESITTVSQAKDLRDNVPVVMTGYIIKSLGDEKYTFQDDSGNMTVEIDDENWRGLTVSPADRVRLRGQVDRGIFSTEIDVERIEKI